MKNNKIRLILIISSILVLIITALLIFVNPEKMNKSLHDILYEINKALILTTIFGTVTKIISDEIIKVKTNDKRMKQLGIHSIGEGRLDKKQTNIMFGGNGHPYPNELKFIFMNGINFFRDFNNHIITAIKNGCHVKVLIADPVKSVDYIKRSNYLNEQDSLPGISIVTDNINKLSAFVKENNYPGSIEVRHYIDEYRYNYRIAKFYHSKDESIKAWINFQPINKIAINQSLTVIGGFDEDYLKEAKSRVSKESDNIVISLDESFDTLWDLYQNN